MPQPKYFQNFPTYDMTIGDTQRTITDISPYINVKDIFVEKAFPFYDYLIADGERPDHVAYRQYGDSKFYWIILVTNNIRDVWREWPMSQKQFTEFIVSKYGSVQAAKSKIVKYFLIDGDVEIDLQTYSTTSSALVRILDAYEYEQELNEEKRRIRLVKREYIAQLQTEIKRLFE